MIVDADNLISKGNDRIQRTVSGFLDRGIIYDRNGQELAISVPVSGIYVDCKELHNSGNYERDDALRLLAKYVDMEYFALKSKLNNPKKRSVYIARQVSENVVDKVKSLKLSGIYFTQDLRRFYPTAEVNAHIIGLTNIDGNGIEGIEKQYNNFLLSSPEKRKQRKDRFGNVIENLGVIQEGKRANDIVLSIDQRLQDYAYKALKYATDINQATSGSLVLIDVKTGEILSMVNTPSYNPNNRSAYQSFKARNRCVTDTYEPGSTTKPLIAIGALNRKITNWREVFDTKPFIVRRKIISDSHYMASGDLFDILKYSSNTGMARIALRMTPRDLLDTLSSFGYGQSTDVHFIGENPGRLPKSRNKWSDIEKATLGFGYGLMVTPLQIAQAYTILANKGLKIPLSLEKVDINEIPKGKRVAPENDVKNVLKALEAVVEDGGTGGQAMITGYRVGGKTGTAKVAIAGGYGNDYVGAFAGMAPMSDPRFVLVVIINEPHAGKYYGGVVAGPVFSKVMDRALQLYNVAPDDLNSDGTLKTIEQKKKEIYLRMKNKH
ncbi:MAG: peptidoglycan D,D-transpeptidase FtsI family protein [Succinivibrionaceae bacterium]